MMKRILWLLAFFALASPAYAADNIAVTPGIGKTIACLDISTVCFAKYIPYDTTGAAFGVTGNPFFVSPASGATFPVTGTFWQTTQPVSAASLPLPSGASTSANQSTANASLAIIATNSGAAIPAGPNLIGKVGIDQTTPGTTNGVVNTMASQYPLGAVPITASATGTTGATTATLTNVSGHTTYICGYSIRANANVATTVTDTVTGVITATMSSELWVSVNTSGLGVDEQIFSPCIPASATSTSIAVVSGAPGTGGLVSVKAWGYSL